MGYEAETLEKRLNQKLSDELQRVADHRFPQVLSDLTEEYINSFKKEQRDLQLDKKIVDTEARKRAIEESIAADEDLLKKLQAKLDKRTKLEKTIINLERKMWRKAQEQYGFLKFLYFMVALLPMAILGLGWLVTGAARVVLKVLQVAAAMVLLGAIFGLPIGLGVLAATSAPVALPLAVMIGMVVPPLVFFPSLAAIYVTAHMVDWIAKGVDYVLDSIQSLFGSGTAALAKGPDFRINVANNRKYQEYRADRERANNNLKDLPKKAELESEINLVKRAKTVKENICTKLSGILNIFKCILAKSNGKKDAKVAEFFDSPKQPAPEKDAQDKGAKDKAVQDLLELDLPNPGMVANG